MIAVHMLTAIQAKGMATLHIQNGLAKTPQYVVRFCLIFGTSGHYWRVVKAENE